MQRTALLVLVLSVATSAVMGCWALVSGGWGQLQAKVLVTALVISGASILAMACGAAWERRAVWPLPPAGVALTLLAAGLLVVGVWGEVRSEPFWKTAGTAGVVAVAATHAAMLGIARLPERFRWVWHGSFALNAILTVLLSVLVWTGEWEGETVWRFVGVVSILLCSGTILVPVLQRVTRTAGPGLDVRFCPACGAPTLAPSGRGRCAACGAAFEVRSA